MKQKTIKSEVRFTGAGLHTGEIATVVLKSAQADTGICFIRVDLPSKPLIKVGADTVVMDAAVTRCTAVANGQAKVYTIEHLLAALSGLGIDNLTIEIDNQEVPGLDGSSLPYVKALIEAEIVELESPKIIFDIKEPIVVASKTATLAIVPADDFNISYTLDYPHPALRSQVFSLHMDHEAFEKELAPARTFCLESEVAEIHSRGLGKGANHQNTLVMGANGPLDNQLRFSDECCRHKALDIVGDLFLLGYHIKGSVFASKSGHALNRELVKRIDAQRKKYALRPYTPSPAPSGTRVFDVNEIMKVLPHRYPFLLVDRVIEVEVGKKGIGIKNVTINDGFFQGHFPSRPVMPGVLMVEAMAQTAGVVVLTGGAHNGKVALFMALNEVKFRKVVSPGDQLMMEVEIIRDRERTAQVKGVAKVDGEVVVEAEMIFSYTDDSYMQGT